APVQRPTGRPDWETGGGARPATGVRSPVPPGADSGASVREPTGRRRSGPRARRPFAERAAVRRPTPPAVRPGRAGAAIQTPSPPVDGATPQEYARRSPAPAWH